MITVSTLHEDDRIRVKQCRHGSMCYFPHDQFVGRALDLYGEYSELEFELLAQLVRPGAHVIEAGAHIGCLTVPLARRVGEAGCIIAFEPQRVLFDMLCANLDLNDLRNVRTEYAAVGSASGSIGVPAVDYGGPGNYGGVTLGGEARETVPVVAIDDLALSRCDLIKADVEGMEADVIAGARKTINRFRPALYVENDRPDKSAALIATIRSMGYTLWWHNVPLFNPANYFAEPKNEFENLISLNMLAMPAELNVSTGLRKVEGSNYFA